MSLMFNICPGGPKCDGASGVPNCNAISANSSQCLVSQISECNGNDIFCGVFSINNSFS